MLSTTDILNHLLSDSILGNTIEHSRIEGEEILFSTMRLSRQLTVSVSNMGSSGLEVHVLARDSETKRLLRNALIGRSRLKTYDTDEYHLLELLSATARAELIAQTIALVLDEVVTRLATIELRATTSATMERPLAPIYWWDSISNFGDVLGPWIVSKRFEVLPLNAWKTPRSGRPLATAGSIIPLIDRDNTYIWGSGMLSPLSATHVARLSLLRNTTVLATRGHRSAEQLSTKLKWQVPEVFGDPALLTSRYYAPDRLPEQHSKVALVCHWEHQKLVDHDNHSVTAVNVKDGVESVVSTIANSKACVSTSLHGIVIAQAYGVPWTWLRLDGHQLHSTDFKFEDFFTTIDKSEANIATVRPENINSKLICSLGKEASKPTTTADLDALDDALSTWHKDWQSHATDRRESYDAHDHSQPRCNSLNSWLPAKAQ